MTQALTWTKIDIDKPYYELWTEHLHFSLQKLVRQGSCVGNVTNGIHDTSKRACEIPRLMRLCAANSYFQSNPVNLIITTSGVWFILELTNGWCTYRFVCDWIKPFLPFSFCYNIIQWNTGFIKGTSNDTSFVTSSPSWPCLCSKLCCSSTFQTLDTPLCTIYRLWVQKPWWHMLRLDYGNKCL